MGQRIITWDSEGNLISDIDTRTLDEVKENKILEFKKNCQDSIYALCPAEKQANAALGLLLEEEANEIKQIISDNLTKYENLKVTVNNCATISEVEELAW